MIFLTKQQQLGAPTINYLKVLMVMGLMMGSTKELARKLL
jgi:hypothetical protein